MAWGSVTTSSALTLTGSLQTVQESGADMEIELNPGETAHVQFDFNPQGTPTEVCEWQIQATPDGTNYDTLPFDAGAIDKDTDPNLQSVIVRDVWGFRVQARLLDTDGTAGGDDTTSTLTVRVIKNGVNVE